MTLEGLRKVNIAASATIVASFCGAVFLPNGWGTASWCGFFGALIVQSVVSRQIRKREAEAGMKDPSAERSIAFVAILATGWAIVDAFVLSQGAIVLILFAIALFYLLPRAIFAYASPPLL